MKGIVAAILLVLTACSAPALMPELAEAERHERAKRWDEAQAAYQRAQSNCANASTERLRYQNCSLAYLGEAELLYHTDRRVQAAELYARIPNVIGDHREASAEACYRAGSIYLDLSQDKLAYRYLWKTVTDYPDEAFAADALKLVVRDGRRRNVVELVAALKKILQAVPSADVADNLLYHLADIAAKDQQNPSGARAYYQQIIDRYPNSGLRDDALWFGAEIARQQGDSKGALRLLKTLQETREWSLGTGSYASVWLDNGQLLMGVILRDDLADLRSAAKVFRELPKLYPTSILKDDALFELAVTYQRSADRAKACAALAKLRSKYPDSKYGLEKAPQLAVNQRCQSGTQ